MPQLSVRSPLALGQLGRLALSLSLCIGLSCGARSDLLSIADGLSLGGSGGATTTSSSPSNVGGTTASATNSTQLPPPNERRLCVFDYDLTLSSHRCPDTENRTGYFCRRTACDTYGWHDQCLAVAAQAAIAECVRRHAYVSIASKADVDYCWADKVVPIVAESQFPDLLKRQTSNHPDWPAEYSPLDDRANWNCDTCPYTMDGSVSKPEGIRRAMRHFGFNEKLAADRARVIFWDDSDANIREVHAKLPEVRAVLVPSFTGNGVDGGCGITAKEIEVGWAP